ncbi:MAG TPA: hypothetical protein VKF36_00185 [Syntrophorhabdales bacterium]|nr:hypothetical protein [Syntrophorhabdales bacterium]
MGADDTVSYRALAEAWPGLPADTLPFHRAQRLAIPFALGGIASVTGCSLEAVFLGATLLSCAVILLLMYRIFVFLSLSIAQRLFLFALLVFNPFIFRPYLAAPFMVVDLVFVVGLSLLLWGLLTNRHTPVALGIAVAALGRQTAMAILPVIVVWFVTQKPGKPDRLKSLPFMLLISVEAVAIYCITGLLASEISERNENLEHLTGLFYWFANWSPGGLPVLLEFVFRGLSSSTATLMILGIVYWRSRKQIALPARFWLLLLLVGSIWAQPFLAGPDITGGNTVRLCALGFVPLLTAVGVVLSHSRLLSEVNSPSLMVLTFLIIAGSFHHLTSKVGEALHYGMAGFAVVHCVLATLTGIVVFLLSQPQPDASRTQQARESTRERAG